MTNSELYYFDERGKITNDGHVMFEEDIVRDLNNWRNKAIKKSSLYGKKIGSENSPKTTGDGNGN